MPIISVTNLRKAYGEHLVLRDVSLEVEAGEIVGVVGPNGAGKTTTVECIGGLRRADAGRIEVDGLDPSTNPARLREIVGMQLQECRLPAKITVTEALELYRSFYPAPRDAGELLERFGLAEHRRQRFGSLSGGQQQRLSVALALVGNPRIAILDELTTGLDPQARRDIWAFLGELQADGVTIVLVTHFMEEAQRLCDRVAVIDDGRVAAFDTPDALATATDGAQHLAFTPSLTISDADVDLMRALPGVASLTVTADRVAATGHDIATPVLMFLAERGITPLRLRVESPTLDDAYLSLTTSAKDGSQ
ncbi:MAG: ABC transporter ATP-binding protein [Humibacillus sp.]|nr:ABC transporter ATP-binding protein [Humibacillus sp.]MDN5777357.1 ABC transporter ATP-binding protein [Humibacillus sp.]